MNSKLDPIEKLFYNLVKLLDANENLNAQLYNNHYCKPYIEIRREAFENFAQALDDYMNLRIDERLKK